MGSSNSIGRAFLEIGADNSALIKGIDQSMKVMGEADAKLNSYGKRLTASFDNALNPTAKLEKQLVALGTQGRSSADMIKVYGDRVLSATDTTMRFGGTLSPVMSQMRDLALANQRAGAASVEMSQSLGRTTAQITEARQAAMLLSRQIGIQLPEAVTGFLGKSQALGTLLSSAFKIAVWGSIGVAIWEAGQRLYEWADGSKKAAEETTKLNKEIEAQTDLFDKNAKAIEEATRRGAAIGLSGGQAGALALANKQADLSRARAELEALSGQFNRLYSQAQQYSIVGGAKQSTPEAVKALEEIVSVQEKMIAAEQAYKLAIIDVANAEKQVSVDAGKAVDSIGESLKKANRDIIISGALDLKALSDIVNGLSLPASRIPTLIPLITNPGANYSYEPPAMPEFDVGKMTEGIMAGARDATSAYDDAWARSWRAMQDQALAHIADIRGAAGHIFDDLLSSGRSIWQSLLDSFKNIFLVPLRTLFQNISQWLFTGTKPSGGLLGGLMPSGSLLSKGMGVLGLGGMLGGTAMAGTIGLGAAGSAALAAINPLNSVAAGVLGTSAGIGTAGVGAGAGGASSIAAFMTNPITIAVVGAIAAGFVSYKLFHKSTSEAGSMETRRDLGVNVSSDQYKSFYESLGLDDNSAAGIRKDLSVSPKFLVEIAAPIAKANGQMDRFLKNLETVKTAWGTYDFRDAFEVGQATGDWQQLNDLFIEAFGNSEALGNSISDWQALLTTGDFETEMEKLVKSLTEFRAAIEGGIAATETMYDIFLNTGVITDDLRQQIESLGGSIEDLQALSDINLQISSLQGTLDFITSLKSAIKGLAPELDPIQQLLSGKMGSQLQASLIKAGLDPSKLANLTSMIGLESKWGNFEAFGTLTGDLREALLKYGGSSGQLAVERYAEGFNTITQALLDQTKSTMDEAYYSAITDALDYLGEQEKKVTDQMQTLIDVANGIRQDIKDMLNVVISNASTSSATTGGQQLNPAYTQWQADYEQATGQTEDIANWLKENPPPPIYIPQAATGGLVRVHDNEAILDPNQTRNLMRGESGTTIQILGDIYGWNDFVEKVAEAGIVLKRRAIA
jgi:hypothetical protein